MDWFFRAVVTCAVMAAALFAFFGAAFLFLAGVGWVYDTVVAKRRQSRLERESQIYREGYVAGERRRA